MTRDLYDQSVTEDELLGVNGWKSTAHDRAGVHGGICQNALGEWGRERGVEVFPFYVPGRTTDEGDGLCRGRRFDVKSHSPQAPGGTVYRWRGVPAFGIKYDEYAKGLEKGIDDYVFMWIDAGGGWRPGLYAYVIGVISFSEAWEPRWEMYDSPWLENQNGYRYRLRNVPLWALTSIWDYLSPPPLEGVPPVTWTKWLHDLSSGVGE